jgi:hypothetical protein
MRKFLVAMTILAVIVGAIFLMPDPAPNANRPLGLEACDNYYDNFMKCMAKVPPFIRPGFEDTIKQMKSQWHASMKTPLTRKAQEQSCITASQNAATSFKSFGCKF